MSFKQYEYIIKTVSSEMFYSLMSLLHEKLPCATNYFRLRKQFKEKNNQKRGADGEKLSSSPIRTIASPKMIRGLSITKQMKNDVSSGGGRSASRSPDVRIRSKKGDALSKGGPQSIGSMGSPKGNFRDFRSKIGSKMEDRKYETNSNDFPASPG